MDQNGPSEGSGPLIALGVGRRESIGASSNGAQSRDAWESKQQDIGQHTIAGKVPKIKSSG